MKIKLLFIFLFIQTLIHAQTIYIIDYIDLYRFDIPTCTYTFMTTIDETAYDISFHPNRSLYGLAPNGDLYEIDTITGQTNVVHTFSISQSYNSLTIADNGLIYATGGRDLVSYDLNTNIETYYGEMPYSAAGDLTFYNGNLYCATDGNRILKIDIDNPPNSEVVIQDNRDFRFFGIVTYIDDCRIIKTYATTDGAADIYEINFEDNTLELVCNLDIRVSGGASTFEYLGASAAINIDSIEINSPGCQEATGLISIAATADTGTISFSIDNTNFQSDGLFENLGVGDYRITIDNDIGCPIFRDFTLDDGNDIQITNLKNGDTKCDEPTGFIVTNAYGGTGTLQYSIDGINYQYDNTFRNVDYGLYEIFVQDEENCIADTSVFILQDDCDIYIPNAFSPNNDGINDVFRIYPHSEFLGHFNSFQIFDRWGNLIFETYNFDANTAGWNGTYRNEALTPNVFVYAIEVEMENGQKKLLKGSVTLLR